MWLTDTIRTIGLLSYVVLIFANSAKASNCNREVNDKITVGDE